MAAPVVTAWGQEKGAQIILEIAERNGIPVKSQESDDMLNLLRYVKPGTAIPEELYLAVARIFSYFLAREDQNL